MQKCFVQSRLEVVWAQVILQVCQASDFSALRPSWRSTGAMQSDKILDFVQQVLSIGQNVQISPDRIVFCKVTEQYIDIKVIGKQL